MIINTGFETIRHVALPPFVPPPPHDHRDGCPHCWNARVRDRQTDNDCFFWGGGQKTINNVVYFLKSSWYTQRRVLMHTSSTPSEACSGTKFRPPTFDQVGNSPPHGLLLTNIVLRSPSTFIKIRTRIIKKIFPTPT